MRDVVKSILEEVRAMQSGRYAPVHKICLTVTLLVSVIFCIVFKHMIVFEGPVAVIDLDASKYTAELIQDINSSPYVRITEVRHNPVPVESLLAHDRNIGVLYFPKGLEKSVKRGDRTVTVGYFADYSNTGQNADAISAISERIPGLGAEIGAARVAALGLGEEATRAAMQPMAMASRPVFNPTKASTNGNITAFLYFFPSLFYCITTLMIVGRLKVMGRWKPDVLERPFCCLLARAVPYALFYSGALVFFVSLLVAFGQMRFEGSAFIYVPAVFMNGLAIAYFSMVISWNTRNPGEGAGRMVWVIPPGFIMGGALLAAGYLPGWAYAGSYCWPLTWMYRIHRDIAMRGMSPADMLATMGAHIIYVTLVAAFVYVLWLRARRHAAHMEALTEAAVEAVPATARP